MSDWVGVVRGDQRLRWVGKPGVMVALIVAALLAQGAPSAVKAWFVVALVLSLVGDVALLLPDQWFLAGLVAFLLAHLAYVAGMVQLDLHPPWGAVDRARAPSPSSAGGSWARWHAEEPPLLGPVTIYLVVISAMAIIAWATGQPWLIVRRHAVLRLRRHAGLAPLRDAGTGRSGHGQRPCALAVMVTYHSAQACFVAFLLTRSSVRQRRGGGAGHGGWRWRPGHRLPLDGPATVCVPCPPYGFVPLVAVLGGTSDLQGARSAFAAAEARSEGTIVTAARTGIATLVAATAATATLGTASAARPPAAAADGSAPRPVDHLVPPRPPSDPAPSRGPSSVRAAHRGAGRPPRTAPPAGDQGAGRGRPEPGRGAVVRAVRRGQGRACSTGGPTSTITTSTSSLPRTIRSACRTWPYPSGPRSASPGEVVLPGTRPRRVQRTGVRRAVGHRRRPRSSRPRTPTAGA